MGMIRRLFLIVAVVTVCMAGRADTLGEARQLMADGLYDQALTVLHKYVKSNPRAKDYGAASYAAGQCAQSMGQLAEAEEYYRKAAAKGVNDAWLQLGRLDCQRYDFAAAVADYAKYKNPDAQVMTERARAERAAGFLDRVEDVVIIDSIAVAKDKLFEVYKLPASVGALTCASDSRYPVFGNEENSSWLTTTKDTAGRLVISRIDGLTTGGTQTYYYPELSGQGNAAYPSMLADGQTLYFASDGPESIGGWDIMISTYDQETGTFRNPQNIGMPYNSPFNDYMMVIDETNGVGWWATDRHTQGTDSVTVYMFIPSELRVNLPADSPDLCSRAMVSDYRATWPEDADYSELLSRISTLRSAEIPEPEEFRFNVDGRRVLTRWEDLPSMEAREALAAYFSGVETVTDLETELHGLHAQWSDGQHSDELREYILRKEAELDRARESLRFLRNNVYSAL